MTLIETILVSVGVFFVLAAMAMGVLALMWQQVCRQAHAERYQELHKALDDMKDAR